MNRVERSPALEQIPLRWREDLVLGCRILAMEGHTDKHLGHLSARGRGEPWYLMKASGYGLEEIDREKILLLDRDGARLDGAGERHNEYPIHGEIYKLRPDVRCVVHTHPTYGKAFSALREPLRPLTHEGCWFVPPPPRFEETSDLITTPELGRAVAECLGSRDALFLRNHGIVVVGSSVQEACLRAIMLEEAVRVQLLVPPSRSPEWSPEPEALSKQRKIFRQEALENLWRYYVRKLAVHRRH